MAFTGPMHISPGALSTVDTTAQMDVGARGVDASGNEYVYLQGVASTAVGSWVTYDEAGVTALLVADAIGPVAVSMGLNVASTYGWYQVFGAAVGLSANDIADNTNIYGTATPGAVDDAVVAGDRMSGAICREAITGATTGAFQLYYPLVTDIAD